MADQPAVSPEAVRQGYEPADIRIGRLLLVIGGSLVVLLLAGLALWGMLRLIEDTASRSVATAVERTPVATPAPRLQPTPKGDLDAYRAQEEAALHRWAWIDRSKGVAQIPVDVAMALLARSGWPQPDRPAGTVPPRAVAEPASSSSASPAGGSEAAPPAAGTATGPAAPTAPAPMISPQETGPAEATPPGGER